MKVLVTNTVLLNGGDAAILTALLRQIRNVVGSETEIVVADTQPELARKYYPELQICSPLYLHLFPPKAEGPFSKLRGAFRFARWYASVPRLYLAAFLLARGLRRSAQLLVTSAEWSTLTEYEAADAVISTGGTYLVENYWLGPRIFEFKVALLLGKPLVLYTQSIGAISKPWTRSALKDVFVKASAIILRDERSQRNVHDLCRPEKVKTCVAADAVFSLADPDALARAASGPREGGSSLRVAVSVRRWPFFRSVGAEEGMEAYMHAVAGLVEHLIRTHDAEVVFLSTCQGVEDYAYDDSRTAATIAEMLGSGVQGAAHVESSYHKPHELLELLEDFDLVVATRMHMAILALVAGVPVLPIAYEFKTAALFDRLDMAELVHDVETVSADALVTSAETILNDLVGVHRRLFPRVELERERAKKAEACIDRVLSAPFRGEETDSSFGCATTAD